MDIIGMGLSPGIVRRRLAGFTLLELMVVLSVIVILSMAVAPLLKVLPAYARVQDRAQRLSTQLQQARSEAVRGNRIVYACSLKVNASLDVSGCQTTAESPNVFNWGQGVLVYADDAFKAGNTAAQYDSGEAISNSLFDGKVDVRANTAQIVFLPSGRTGRGQSVTFEVLDQVTNTCRTVLMDASGRARACKPGEVNCDVCS